MCTLICLIDEHFATDLAILHWTPSKERLALFDSENSTADCSILAFKNTRNPDGSH